MEIKQFLLEYEIGSRDWLGLISNEFLQQKLANYFAWRVNGKFERYQKFLKRRRLKEELK